MRRLIDSLIAVMMVAILLVAVWQVHQRHAAKVDLEQARRTLVLLTERALYVGATGQEQRSPCGFPLAPSPDWFEKRQAPLNPMVGAEQPWIDVAPVGDLADHPPDPVVISGLQAGFWYNPTRGIVRARVLPQPTEQQTLALYNRVNQTAMVNLPRHLPAARKPLALAQAQKNAAATRRAVESAQAWRSLSPTRQALDQAVRNAPDRPGAMAGVTAETR